MACEQKFIGFNKCQNCFSRFNKIQDQPARVRDKEGTKVARYFTD